MLLEPMKQVASAGGECFRLFFKEVPLQWQPVLFIALFIVLILVIITSAGFEVRTPLLSFIVRRPEHAQNTLEELRRLQIENQRITERMERLQLQNGRQVIESQDLSDYQRIETVGSHNTAELSAQHPETALPPQVDMQRPSASPVPREFTQIEERVSQSPASRDINRQDVSLDRNPEESSDHTLDEDRYSVQETSE